MQIDVYNAFVKSTDLNVHLDRIDREDIAIYGLVGEMGALTSAVKRRLIAEKSGVPWNMATDEVVEEIGDAFWYWVLLCQIYQFEPVQILKNNISSVAGSLNEKGGKGELFRKSVGPARSKAFGELYSRFMSRCDLTFDDYREVSFLTRRTDGKVFVGVCLTVLAQLGAELLRGKFPEVEDQINTVIQSRTIDNILGEVAWHLAAISGEYKLDLMQVLGENIKKLKRRLDKSSPTKSHDEQYPNHEHIPRKFDISFVMVGRENSRMYLNGRRLGDELTDNSYSDDGYRFHDVLHFAVLANLGWSPVIRDLMKKKRKSRPKTDEVEDGARARIVEEAVIKAIHSEGLRVSAPRARIAGGHPVPLFSSHSEITFQFLKFIENLTKGLEVERNQYWEWERAMLQASEVFHKLRNEEQGTVRVDLDTRQITFVPDVVIDGPSMVASLGSALVDVKVYSDAERASREDIELAEEGESLLGRGALLIAEQVARKRAILNSLNLPHSIDSYREFRVTPFEAGVSVKATGAVRDAMWARKIIGFRCTIASTDSSVVCNALALTDPRDASS